MQLLYSQDIFVKIMLWFSIIRCPIDFCCVYTGSYSPYMNASYMNEYCFWYFEYMKWVVLMPREYINSRGTIIPYLSLCNSRAFTTNFFFKQIRFFDWMLELFRECAIFVLFFILYIQKTHKIIFYRRIP